MIWLLSFGGIGMVLLLCGIAMLAWEDRKKKRCVEKCEGVICSAKRYYSDHRHMYCPIYEYEYGNEVYRRESFVSSNAQPKIGKKVTLYINPDKPEEYYTKSVIMKMIEGIFISIGVIFIVIGVALVYFEK